MDRTHAYHRLFSPKSNDARTFCRSVSGLTTAMWSSSVLRKSAKQTTVSEAPLATANSKQVSFSLGVGGVGVLAGSARRVGREGGAYVCVQATDQSCK